MCNPSRINTKNKKYIYLKQRKHELFRKHIAGDSVSNILNLVCVYYELNHMVIYTVLSEIFETAERGYRFKNWQVK